MQQRDRKWVTSDINRVNEMLDIRQATALSHILTPLDMPLNCPTEPSDFNTCFRVIGMPECAHFLPLRRIATIPLGDDNLFDSEAVESGVWSVVRGGLSIDVQHVFG